MKIIPTKARRTIKRHMSHLAQLKLTGWDEPWSLWLKLHELYDLYRQISSRTRSEIRIARLKQSRRFDTSYWQAGSVSVTHTLTLSTFTTLRVKSRTTQFMSTRWLRCVCPYARASDSVEEQEYFNLKQATVNSKPYRTPRRQEVGGPK